MTLTELKKELEQAGEKSFRAAQLYDWMHCKLAAGYDEMTNLPLSLRSKLKGNYPYTSLLPIEVQESRLDGTKKFLFGLAVKWAAASVLPHWMAGKETCFLRKCWIRFTPSAG